MDASSAGTFKIGGELEVNRLGYGAMQITGKGIWGPPEDRGEALAMLRRLPALKVNFVDTADSYGPFHSENLIREALHPYEGMVVATKAGLVRHGPRAWLPLGRPEYLRHACLTSLDRLDVERIDLFQLHRIDPKVPREEQFEAMRALQDDGLIRHIGLSEVSIEEIEAAAEYFDVATVQNRFNLAERNHEDVLEYCERNGIGFIPWYPLASGKLAEPGGAVAGVAAAHDATPGQVALAWLLARSRVILPIPGTSSVRHLEENAAAASLRLTTAEIETLNAAA